ncbi:MAG: hypothetical protein ACREPE_08435 [Lysobacter sp.]
MAKLPAKSRRMRIERMESLRFSAVVEHCAGALQGQSTVEGNETCVTLLRAMVGVKLRTASLLIKQDMRRAIVVRFRSVELSISAVAAIATNFRTNE